MKIFGFLLSAMMFTTSVYAGNLTLHTPVIAGKFSRAGSSNREPLGTNSLTQLCNQGYTLVMFLYPGAREQTITCGGGRTLKYISKSGWSNPGGILAAAKSEIDQGGKVLVHCWYGVHAAKFVAASALNKFCGYSGSRAADYFVRGIPPGSLPPARIEELASRLRRLPSGGPVIGGCP